MLKGNEYQDMGFTPTYNKFNDVDAARRTAESLLRNCMDDLDVQPPTPESLAASVVKGIEVGRELYKEGFGEGAVIGALHRITQDQYVSWPFNDNASSFQQAGQEAYQTSGFRFLSTDFQSPLDAGLRIRESEQSTS